MALISIVLPTYNGEKYIRQSIESIINQSFTDWELIIVNDCSTDSTPKIIKEYANSDARIKIIDNKTNKKLPASLNIGFDIATGDYLTWTSDDNQYKPNALKTMYDYLKSNPDVDFVSCDMDWFDENQVKLGVHSDWGIRTTPLTLAWLCNVGACFMYKKEVIEIIGKYDESTFCAEDYDYWCKMALNCKMAYLPSNEYIYLSNKNNLSHTHRNHVDEMGNKVRVKYADKIIKRYSKSYLETIITYGRLKDKFNTYPLKLKYKVAVFLIYRTSKMLIGLIPIKTYRKNLRNKLCGCCG